MAKLTLDDEDLQQHYDDLFATFGTPGWRRFVEQVGAFAERAGDVRTMKLGETVDFRRGQIEVLDWFRTFQAQHEFAYVELLKEQDGGSDDGEV